MNRLQVRFPTGPVILDGAIATELQRRGLALGESADFWNRSRPADVAAITREYAEAGARVVLTNTFRASPLGLGIDDDAILTINREAVKLARQAVRGDVCVFGSIGPSGRSLARGEATPAEVGRSVQVQARALADAGVDAIVFETFSEIAEAALSVRVASETGLPVVVTFSFHGLNAATCTLAGATPEQVGRAMADVGVDAVGANCGEGPEGFAAIGRRLREASRQPLWLKPNAGLPVMRDGRAEYAMRPEEFASHLPDMIAAGATFVGGCCGTSPAVIAALAKAALALGEGNES